MESVHFLLPDKPIEANRFVDDRRRGDSNMKKFSVFVITIITLASFLLIDAAFAGRAGKRQVRQQKRIHHGIATDELTAGEVRRLEREQRRIQRNKRKFRSDGEISAEERLRLERQQDRASRHIYRARHNDNRR